MARGFAGLFRRFGVVLALTALALPRVASQTSTIWGPPEDPALVCAQADQSRALRPGETAAVFVFRLANVSSENVVVLNVISSCGCATPKHPPTPWQIGPGQTGEFQITMDVHGKTGTVEKGAAVETQKGVRPLTMRVTIPAAPSASATGSMREKNLQLAAVDRQAVFKGDCARCHVAPSAGLAGQPLYAAACGICHDAAHRASMVPDLRRLEHPTDREFWRQMIAQGKPGTLMPAFAREHGGPLSTPQIDSLARYLTETLSPLHPAKSNAPAR